MPHRPGSRRHTVSSLTPVPQAAVSAEGIHDAHHIAGHKGRTDDVGAGARLLVPAARVGQQVGLGPNSAKGHVGLVRRAGLGQKNRALHRVVKARVRQRVGGAARIPTDEVVLAARDPVRVAKEVSWMRFGPRGNRRTNA